jgi:photosystem II stability/assembly factor-like uncharacterized protein
MKKLILSELLLLFLATTFVTDSPPPGWYQQTLPVNDLINDIYFLDSLAGWVVTAGASSSSDTGYIMKTTDGGTNWFVQYRPIMNFNTVQFINSNTGYAGGGDGLAKFFKTSNGGTNWNLAYSFGFITIKDLSFVSKDTGWICDDNPLNGGIFKTTNGGTNWIPQAGPSYRPKKLFFINSDTGWAISEDNKIYWTVNSGLNWILQHNFGSEDLVDVFFTSEDTGWIHGGATGLYKTTNSGFNWDTISTPFGYGSGNIYFTDSKHGWIGRSFSRILVTSNGLTWGYQNTPTGNHYAVYFIDTLKGWAGGDNLIHTTDGGGPPAGITQITNEIPDDFILYQNYPNPFNPSTKMKFDILKSSFIEIKIYSIDGKLVKVLVSEKLGTGEYETEFFPEGLASGVYFYSLIADSKIINTKKMILLK